VPTLGVSSTSFVLRGVDDHFVGLGRNLNRAFALRANARLAGMLIAYRKLGKATGTCDGDGHGKAIPDKLRSSLLRSPTYAGGYCDSLRSSSLTVLNPFSARVSSARSLLSTISATAGRSFGRASSG